MKFLALIPARGGSKGVPGKNIKPFRGKPLLYYTLDIATQIKDISTVCVSSDDAKIIEVANTYNQYQYAPFVRPKLLAQDGSPTLPVILHALDYFEQYQKIFDAVILFQPTTPFRSINMVKLAIQRFKETNADALISVREVPHQYNPHWIFEANEKDFLQIATGEKKIITRRQLLPKGYYRDGALYITKVETLRKQSLYGENTTYIINKDEPHFNIDTIEDWNAMENYNFEK